MCYEPVEIISDVLWCKSEDSSNLFQQVINMERTLKELDTNHLITSSILLGEAGIKKGQQIEVCDSRAWKYELVWKIHNESSGTFPLGGSRQT